jgi:hypothetical protein
MGEKEEPLEETSSSSVTTSKDVMDQTRARGHGARKDDIIASAMIDRLKKKKEKERKHDYQR